MTAAATRKLQKEIETVLKRVEDGISEFADCWDQANAASAGPQKERLGEELKRSINKLQRFRSQIREWLGQSTLSSELKDTLEKARKQVEYDMQRFKDFERDLKTKAFSTNALSRGDDGLDGDEAEKARLQDWLAQTIQTLNDQTDQFDADLELLSSKRSLSSDEKDQQSELRSCIDRHRWHIRKLEQVLRALDNDAIDLNDLATVRGAVDSYVDSSNEDAEFYHDESVYDCFDLTEFEDKASKPSDMVKECSTPASSLGKDDAKKAKDKDKQQKKNEKKEKKKDEKNKAGTSGGAVGVSTAKGGAKAGDAKILTPAMDDSICTPEAKEPAEPEEVKVQEDQLLSEAEEFVCKICQIHVAGCGPKLTSCSHLFCGDCIAQWFNQHPKSQTWAQRAKSAGNDRVVPCPCCKQPLSETKDLYPVCGVTSRSENLLLWRMLSSLKIVCVNHPKVRKDGRCDWTGEYGTYQKHALVCKNEPGAARIAPEPVAPAPAPAPLPAAAPAAAPAPAPAPAPVPEPIEDEPSPPDDAPTRPARAESGVGSSGDSDASGHAAEEHSSAKADDLHVEEPREEVARPAPAPAAESVAAPAETKDEDEAQEAEASFTVRALTTFQPTSPNMILVQTGDMLEILEQHGSGWTYAKNLSAASGSAAGWIPSWLVPARPAQDAVERAQQPDEQAPPSSEAAAQPQVAAVAPAPAEPAAAAVPAAPRPQPEPQPQPRPAAAAQVEPAPAPAATVAPEAIEPVAEVMRACASFNAATPSQLTLAPEDLVEVIERHDSGWTYGRKVTGLSGSGLTEGWFPAWAVVQK